MALFARRNRNRARPQASGRRCSERIDWRRAGSVAGALAGCAAFALLLALALRPPDPPRAGRGPVPARVAAEIEAAVAEAVKGRLATCGPRPWRGPRIERIEVGDPAVVRRSWPDALRVAVTEQVPRGALERPGS